MAQDVTMPNPRNGFSAQERGALRLSGEQARQLKLIYSAPVTQFYPAEALARRQVGKAMVDLLIDASGVVIDVRVLDEDPLGVGFGDSAAAFAKTFKFWNPLNRLVALTAPVRFVP
jgi:TonB family protein